MKKSMFRRSGATDGEPILLIGYGWRGRQWESALARRADARIAGVVDPDADARGAARERGHVTWPSLEEALGEARPGAALVASPPGEHVGQSVACLSAGVAVLVEKPLALSVASGASVAETARARGRPALVAQNFRFIAREISVARVLGRLGNPSHAVVSSARPSRAIPPHVATLDHGTLWDICLHHFDAFRLRFGLPESIRATSRAGRAGGSLYTVELAWPRGFTISYRHSEGAPGFQHLEYIEGSRGAITVVGQRTSFAPAGRRFLPVLSLPPGRPESRLLDGLIESMKGITDESLGAEDNLATVAIVEAACASIAQRRTVAVEDVESRVAPLPGAVDITDA